MAKKLNVPAVRSRQDLARRNPNFDTSLDRLYPTKPVLPPASRFNFINEARAKRVQSYTKVVQSTNDFLHSLSEHQRALGRLYDIGSEVKYDRAVVAYNYERVNERRRNLRASAINHRKQYGKGNKQKRQPSTAFGEVDDNE